MEKGPIVLVLRKFDLSKEAEDGESVCERLFCFQKTLDQTPQGKSGEDEAIQDLFRYFISLDNLHRDICGENLSTCVTKQLKTGREINIAFSRVEDKPDDLYVFACPTQTLESDTRFKVLSEKVFTILDTCFAGRGHESSGIESFDDVLVPQANDWLEGLFLLYFDAESSQTPDVVTHGNACGNIQVKNVIAHHLLESSCNPFFLTAFGLHFTVFSRQKGGEVEIVYTDSSNDTLLPWLLCQIPIKTLEGDSRPNDPVILASKATPEDLGSNRLGGRDCFVKLCERGRLQLCLMCTMRPNTFYKVVNEANWVWILKGIEKLSLNILSGIKDLGLVQQQQQGAPLQKTYVGNGVFVDK